MYGKIPKKAMGSTRRAKQRKKICRVAKGLVVSAWLTCSFTSVVALESAEWSLPMSWVEASCSCVVGWEVVDVVSSARSGVRSLGCSELNARSVSTEGGIQGCDRAKMLEEMSNEDESERRVG